MSIATVHPSTGSADYAVIRANGTRRDVECGAHYLARGGASLVTLHTLATRVAAAAGITTAYRVSA